MDTSRIFGLIVLLASGCASAQSGHAYNLTDGRSAVVIARRSFFGAATLRASLPDGEACSGSLSDMDRADVASAGASRVPITNNAEASRAVLTCDAGRVLRCTLAGRYEGGFSYGACSDDHGAEFAVIF